MWCAKVFILGLILQVCVMISDFESTNEDYADENDKYIPNFVTVGQEYSIPVGSTVVLPCKLNHSEFHREYILAWKKDNAVLSAGHIKVSMNPRIKLIQSQSRDMKDNSINLEIKQVRTSDTGKYICQLSSTPPREVVHTLVALVPPKITFLSPAVRLEVAKGSPIHLECHGEGNPPPTISWSRKNNVMHNGENEIIQDILEIPHADRSSIGTYKCTADNRVGQPDTRDIEVYVIYPPEIEVERPIVHTGVGFEAHLVCIVHAEPPPIIHWFMDTTQLATTERHSQQNRGNRYTMMIRNVSFFDFGNYTCQAANKLGKERKGMTLTGVPVMSVFDSPTLGPSREHYNISWTTVSYAFIFEYRLFYHQHYTNKGTIDDELSTNKLLRRNQPYSSNSRQFDQLETPPTEHWNVVSLIERTHNKIGRGSNVADQYVIFQYPNDVLNPRHRMSFMLRNLTPASSYEARVQARNSFGWNELSTVFHFSTRAEDVEVELSAQPAISKNADVDGSNHSRGHKFSPFYSFLMIILYFVSR
ncbi:lachesin-like isoform X2 [Lutzomyia longipalpis]|uniref:lachesin-like isoform X2 n=1 Tax=Lutzomyia longipalpis TaxID=7200 RepID=UPI0024840C11|nr:lachesin-like isoform X2 [Lutzomyia longipalpis]